MRKAVAPPPAPTLEVRFQGRVIRMRKFTSRDYLTIRKGTADDIELIELTLNAVTDFGGADPWDLSPTEVSSLMSAWLDAANEVALPPATA